MTPCFRGGFSIRGKLPLSSPGTDPIYSAGIDTLVVTDSFDSYANFTAAEVNYNLGRNHNFCSLITPGRSGIGKAIRLSYGIGFIDDILFGTEGKLSNIGDWNGTLPAVAGPYTHFYFSTYFRFSSGADPADHSENGIKGFMFWNPDGSRYEFACNQLVQSGGTRCLKIFNPSNAQSGLNVWKTVDGLAPLMSSINDNIWHKFTTEFKVGPAIPTNQRGVKAWLDGVLIYNDMGVDVVTGQGLDGGYTYDEPISHWTVFGNFFNSTDGVSNAFTLDIDDWIAWTN